MSALPNVPPFESPFFQEWLEEKQPSDLVRDVATQLNEKGYAILDFPDDDFDGLVTKIREDLDDRYDWETWREKGWKGNDGLRIQDAWQFNEAVKTLAASDRILDVLRGIYDREPIPFQTLNFPVGTQQAAHSDAIHFHCVPERYMCGVWVALEDIEEDAGPLIYYPGSHKWPVYSGDQVGGCAMFQERSTEHYGKYVELWQALAKHYGVEPEVFRAKKGQALIWAANLIHGGMKQTNPERTRWSQVSHYYFEDCAYYPPIMSDPFLGNIRLREDLVNIRTGEPVVNQYLGQEIPAHYITSCTRKEARKRFAQPVEKPAAESKPEEKGKSGFWKSLKGGS